MAVHLRRSASWQHSDTSGVRKPTPRDYLTVSYNGVACDPRPLGDLCSPNQKRSVRAGQSTIPEHSNEPATIRHVPGMGSTTHLEETGGANGGKASCIACGGRVVASSLVKLSTRHLRAAQLEHGCSQRPVLPATRPSVSVGGQAPFVIARQQAALPTFGSKDVSCHRWCAAEAATLECLQRCCIWFSK